MKILLLLNWYFNNFIGIFTWFAWYIQNKIEFIMNNLMNSSYYFIYIPLFFLWLWFFETVWIVWFFIPLEIVCISIFAYLHNHFEVFMFSVFFLWFSIYLWLIVWYFIWNKYYSKILVLIENRFPALKDYFKQIDEYFEKYHFLAFPVVINMWWIRPIMALHLWWRWYNFKKFLAWSLLATVVYIVPRAIVWYLVWVFWKIILQYFKIWTKYVFYGLIVLIIVALIMDIFIWEKELEKK